MATECQLATEKLREIATRDVVDEKECHQTIRYLAIILLSMKDDMHWVKTLLSILLISVLSFGGYYIVV